MHDRFLPALPSFEPREAVEQELQDFCYTVSHDLAASFRHLSAFSRLLVEDFEGSLTSRQRAYADQIRSANTRCQLMMEQLLVFSRAQQRVLAPSRLDASMTMEQAMLQLAHDGPPLDAEIELEPLGFVRADADLLGLTFRHLLGNALKFRRPGQRPHIAITSDGDAATWRLRIRDDGVGLDPRSHEKAFRMFQRLGGDAYPGVGAGLAICRRIAHRHGGDVRFLDAGAGACVELSLPQVADPA
jgi:light-regulated signal transduction histidine kinase (bacteriophytochrome)